MSRNRVIGKQNKIPWNIPGEHDYYMEKTNGHIIVMGRKTFESLEEPMEDRFSIVLSHKKHTSELPYVVWATSLEEVKEILNKIAHKWPEEVFLIGGGEIYKQTLSWSKKIYLTLIGKEYDGDVFYPKFNTEEYKEIQRTDLKDSIPVSIRIYENNTK